MVEQVTGDTATDSLANVIVGDTITCALYADASPLKGE